MYKPGERQQKKAVIEAYVIEEESKIGLKYPLDIKALMEKTGLDPRCDRGILIEIIREMNNRVIAHHNKTRETWDEIDKLDKGEQTDESKYYRENLFKELVKLVGQENADKWQTLNREERWEAVQDFCYRHFKWQYRIKHDNDLWVCTNSQGRVYKSEDNYRRVKYMPLNSMIKYGKDLYDPEDKDLARMYGDMEENMNQLKTIVEEAKRTKEFIKNIKKAIAAKEKETGSLLDLLGDEEETTDEDIRKLLKGD
jgi:hypothetical protein